MKICVFRGADGWRFRTVAANGRKITVSEAYSSRSNAERAARSFRDFWSSVSNTVQIEVENG